MIAMDANPSIEEMRHDLETGKAAGIDFFRKHEYTPKCSRCGNQHPTWWYLQNGVRYCNVCATKDPCLEYLPEFLINESGLNPTIGVEFSRFHSEQVIYHTGTVGEFLSNPINQYGLWLIDGGWGGPPGPRAVRWDGTRWEDLGFRGYNA